MVPTVNRPKSLKRYTTELTPERKVDRNMSNGQVTRPDTTLTSLLIIIVVMVTVSTTASYYAINYPPGAGSSSTTTEFTSSISSTSSSFHALALVTANDGG